ncbi:polyprenol phosphomannose-dependent alpha 1,6 mannosyltransferase MptB [Intrasporangium sp.]|uniref:polyprenol phosphomannose-dependent alpha 1,6 mannosyltransferase MptB n=1 Tax=Intrasporangium sp. TaxID=1925024 RepID=UPI00293A9428|nr:polyprenol phosphomannose-dependent alpha 1,6 mannosyltransferase MptB [Intrasporangium sp.]MDV3219853.1 polyprenol phosphomannose-dependent alpha 1,6 mannosyltransferase MptB [Intrasporangium sp.]
MGDGPARQAAPDPAVWRAVGVAAAIALAASSWGSGSRPTLHTRILWPGLTPFAETGGSPLAATVSVAAMAVLLLAWWRLRGALVTERWWWATAALWFAPLLASVPLYSRDLYSYAAQGALWAEGLSPYEHGVRDLASDWRESTAPTWLDTPSPYGPVWLLIARGAATVAGDELWVAVLLLRLVAVGGLVVLAWAVSDVARRVGAAGHTAAWLAVATPLVGAHVVSGAHNDAVMVAAVVAGFALALRGWLVRAVLVVAVGAMVKVTAVVALPFLALLWARRLAESRVGPADPAAPVEVWQVALRPREVISGLALTVVTAALPMALVSRATGLGADWVDPAGTAGRNEQWTSLPTALGMAVGAVGHVLGRPEWRDTGISVARGIGLVVLVVVLVLVWLGVAKPGATVVGAREVDHGEHFGAHVTGAVEAGRARIVRACGWAFLAVVVLAPAFLGWYFLWALPLLAATLGTGALSGTLERWLPVAATVLCFAQLPDGYSLGLTTTAIGVPVAVVAVVLLLRGAVRWSRRADWAGLLDLERPLDRPFHGGLTVPTAEGFGSAPGRGPGGGPGGKDLRVSTSAPPPSGPGSGWATTELATTTTRRRGAMLVFALPVLALLAFALWAWTARVHEDDVAAYRELRARFVDVQRDLVPLGQSTRPPCGITDEGWAELTWGAISGPTTEEVETYLRAFGWRRDGAETGIVLRLQEEGRGLTARISPPSGDVGVRLTGTSEADSLACLLH